MITLKRIQCICMALALSILCLLPLSISEALVEQQLSEAHIQGAINWAVSQEGATQYTMKCLSFVSTAFANAGFSNKNRAGTAAEASSSFSRRFDYSNMPKGCLVYYTWKSNGKELGHVGIHIGDGVIVSANGKLKKVTRNRYDDISGLGVDGLNGWGWIGGATPPEGFAEGTGGSTGSRCLDGNPHNYSNRIPNDEHESQGHRVLYFCSGCGQHDGKVHEEWVTKSDCNQGVCSTGNSNPSVHAHTYTDRRLNETHEAKGHRVLYFCSGCGQHDGKVHEEWAVKPGCREGSCGQGGEDEKNEYLSINSWFENKIVTAGETIYVYAQTSNNAYKMELINEQGEVCAGSSSPTSERSGVKEWRFGWKTERAGTRFLTLRVYYGKTYNDYTLSAIVNEAKETGDVRIISANFKNPNVTSGETINVYAKTSENVTRLELINEEGEVCAQFSGSPTTHRNGEKEWDFTWGTVKTGNRSIKMKAYGAGGSALYPLTAYVKENSSAHEYDEVVIISANFANPTVASGEAINVYAKTSDNTIRLELVNEDNEVCASYSGNPTTHHNGEKEWNFTWGTVKPGNRMLTLTAYSSKDQSDPWDLTAYVQGTGANENNSQSSGEVKIISANFKNPTVTSGETINVYAKTSESVTRLELINEEGEVCAQFSGSPTTQHNGEKEWDFTWGTVKTGNRVITMKAYAANGQATYTLTAVVNSSAGSDKEEARPSGSDEIIIYSAEFDRNQAYPGEIISATVVTSMATNSVSVMSSAKYANTTQNYGIVQEVDGRKVWTFSFMLPKGAETEKNPYRDFRAVARDTSRNTIITKPMRVRMLMESPTETISTDIQFVAARITNEKVYPGDVLNFYVRTTDNVEKIEMYDDYGNVQISVTSPYSHENGQKFWSFDWTLDHTGSWSYDEWQISRTGQIGVRHMLLKASGNGAMKTTTVLVKIYTKSIKEYLSGMQPPQDTIEDNISGLQILSSSFSPSDVIAGETIAVYAKTSGNPNALELINEQGEICAAASTSYTDSDDVQEWHFIWQTEKVGSRQLTLRATKGEQVVTQKMTAIVRSEATKANEPSTDGGDDPEPAENTTRVISASFKNPSVTSGETVNVYAKTSEDVTRLDLINEDNEVCASYNGTPTTHHNGEKEWDFTWGTVKTGNRSITLKAYSTTGHATYSLTAVVHPSGASSEPDGEVNNDAVKIISANFKNPNVTSGETINVYAKTSANVERIELINETGEVCAQTSGNPATHHNGEKEWDFTWGTVKTGNRLIVMRAYGGNQYDSTSLSAVVRPVEVAVQAAVMSASIDTIEERPVEDVAEKSTLLPEDLGQVTEKEPIAKPTETDDQDNEPIVQEEPTVHPENEKPIITKPVDQDEQIDPPVTDADSTSDEPMTAPLEEPVTPINASGSSGSKEKENKDEPVETEKAEAPVKTNNEIPVTTHKEAEAVPVSVVEIFSAHASPNEVLSGGTVGISVRTSADVSRVELRDESGQVVAETSSPVSTTGTEKAWSLNWRTSNSGQRTLKVVAAGGGKSAGRSISVTVSDASPIVAEPPVVIPLPVEEIIFTPPTQSADVVIPTEETFVPVDPIGTTEESFDAPGETSELQEQDN